MITIVDYGMGNLGAVLNMFKRVGAKAEITSDVARIADARKLLLPGVGAFDSAMQRINDSGLRAVLDRKALEERIPILGICLGMQLLTRGSEEGRAPGLGWIQAQALRFPVDAKLKVPHMGWNEVAQTVSHPLWDGIAQGSRFYFVHSYFPEPAAPELAAGTSTYGVPFTCAVARDNVFAVQFHPEKSQAAGLKLLSNFVSWRPAA
jgi:glutamine amidotransferase